MSLFSSFPPPIQWLWPNRGWIGEFEESVCSSGNKKEQVIGVVDAVGILKMPLLGQTSPPAAYVRVGCWGHSSPKFWLQPNEASFTWILHLIGLGLAASPPVGPMGGVTHVPVLPTGIRLELVSSCDHHSLAQLSHCAATLLPSSHVS